MSDWNNKIIEEFRTKEGKIGGPFEGAPLLLLHTVGARTGQERVNPMMYLPVDGGYAVFASKAGAPSNPDWYHNLLAHPKVTAEIGTRTAELIARVAEGDERERIWAAQKAAYPGFADYERQDHPADPGRHPRARPLTPGAVPWLGRRVPCRDRAAACRAVTEVARHLAAARGLL